MARFARWGLFVQEVQAGVQPVLYATTSPDAAGGGLYGPDGPGQFTGAPTELAIYRSARKRDDAVRLRELSEQLADVTFAAVDPEQTEALRRRAE